MAADSLNPKGRVRLSATRIERRLLEIVEQRQAGLAAGEVSAGWLLPHRATFREWIRRDQRLEFAFLLRDGNERLRPLLVWLLGRSTSRFRLLGLDRLVTSDDPALRKHVAKALHRLEAHASLAAMADLWPDDPWVCRFASANTKPHSPFRERLLRFVSCNVDASRAAEAIGQSRMEYWARDRWWFLSPPKSAQVIRRLLIRIRRWAHQ